MTCQTVVGMWHRGGGGMRWVRESSWDARLEHGAPSGPAPQFSPKFSRLCFHPSLTQNTALPGWQCLVCFPPPRAECWTWYAIPTSAAFDDAKRVTLLRFGFWQRICPAISLCHVIQQTCPGSKSCHIDLNWTRRKKKSFHINLEKDHLTGEISRGRWYIGSLFGVFLMYFTLQKGAEKRYCYSRCWSWQAQSICSDGFASLWGNGGQGLLEVHSMHHCLPARKTCFAFLSINTESISAQLRAVLVNI